MRPSDKCRNYQKGRDKLGDPLGRYNYHKGRDKLGDPLGRYNYQKGRDKRPIG